jgi:hypothetical protein
MNSPHSEDVEASVTCLVEEDAGISDIQRGLPEDVQTDAGTGCSEISGSVVLASHKRKALAWPSRVRRPGKERRFHAMSSRFVLGLMAMAVDAF